MSAQRPPPASLPPAATPAWRAYQHMEESKAAHYAYLESLETKYAAGGAIQLAERAHLDALLDMHGKRVAAFAEAIRALAETDVAARDALLVLITESGDQHDTSH